jgi:hypothetical protein
MIGTTGGAVLVAVSLLLAGLLGVGAGWLACLLLRQRWSLKTASIDCGVAVVVMLIASLTDATIEAAHGTWETHEALIFLIAAASAAARHLRR